MAKVYKIHPAIGIARVGKSDQGYFLASETLDGKPFEVDDTGEVVFTGYKDNAKLMRRQGARFRIFEYEQDDGGQQTLLGEVTAAQAKIEWTVKIASRKAAGVIMDANQADEDGALIVTPGTGFRNDPPPGSTRDDLLASIDLSATGTNFKPNPKPMAQFLKKPFYIGEARTDFAGRLVVLGGMGTSATWTASRLVSFLNNRGWHDDIADGPVDARITLNGTQNAVDAVGAWVVVAPPDFAPDITAMTTLYDVAVQAREGLATGTVSYVMDIEPIFQRVADYFWVNEAGGGVFWTAMRDFLQDPNKLKDNSEGNKEHRESVEDVFLESERVMIDFRFTKRQKDLVRRWAKGDFIAGPDTQRPEPNAGQVLDRAALSRAVGGGFFPGIEAGLLLREQTIYSELCRLTRGTFNDFGGGQSKLRPGSLTERMACPWQADFVQCLGAWWPAQRPDLSLFNESGAEDRQDWDRGVRIGSAGTHESRNNMVDHFAQLGVIEAMTVGGKPVFAEKGRDPALDTGT